MAVRSIPENFAATVGHPAFGVIFSYSLAWITALSPHGVLLSAYLKESGVSELWISFFRAAGAVFGIASTWLFPMVVGRLGLITSASMFYSSQAVCVSLCLLTYYVRPFSFLSDDPSLSLLPFLVTVVLSRVGLYGFAIGEAEMVQTLVEEPLRGKIGGAERSLGSTATLLIYLLGVLFSSPSQFGVLLWASVIAVNAGALSFLLWSVKKIVP